MCPSCVNATKHKGEAEVLLGSQNTFRVIGRRKEKNHTVIQCEFVSNANNPGQSFTHLNQPFQAVIHSPWRDDIFGVEVRPK